MNSIYESNVPPSRTRITAETDNETRREWIIDKYVKKLFVSPSEADGEKHTADFFEALKRDDIGAMLFHYAHGANIEAKVTPSGEFVAKHIVQTRSFPQDMPVLCHPEQDDSLEHVPFAEQCQPEYVCATISTAP